MDTKFDKPGLDDVSLLVTRTGVTGLAGFTSSETTNLRAKMYGTEKLILKSLRFVPFMANLTPFGWEIVHP